MSAAKQLGGSKHNGLAAWRQRQAEERRQRLAALEALRENAETVERDGRTYRVVRIPDLYDFGSRPEPKPETLFHRHTVQIAYQLTRGVTPSSSGGSPP